MWPLIILNNNTLTIIKKKQLYIIICHIALLNVDVYFDQNK